LDIHDSQFNKARDARLDKNLRTAARHKEEYATLWKKEPRLESGVFVAGG
jgi:hypothetical protein